MAPRVNKKNAPANADTVATPTPAKETVVEPVVDATADGNTSDSAVVAGEVIGAAIPSSLDIIATNLGALNQIVKNTNAAIKTLQKEYNKLVKLAAKKGKGRRNALAADGTKRNPSGFAKPAPLNQAMCDFMKVEFGTEEPRQKVTQILNTYIKDHDLQNPKNRKFILPDETLKKLLGLGDEDVLSYFNLQTFIGRLFVPKVLAAPPAAPVAVAIATA